MKPISICFSETRYPQYNWEIEMLFHPFSSVKVCLKIMDFYNNNIHYPLLSPGRQHMEDDN